MNISKENLSKQQYCMIRSAIEMAEKSELLMKVGSVLCDSGLKIIGDFNRHGDCFKDPSGSKQNVCTIHAEIGVCIEYYQKFQKISFKNIRKFVLCVVRISPSGEIKNSKPCKECISYLKKWFPCKILYSTEDGFFLGKIRDIESDHLSLIQIKRKNSPQGKLSKHIEPIRNSSSSSDDE
jgi:hypothetical protein